ncbi:MAG: NFACT family protein [Candidatus Micrarchaeota archaeon]
MHRTLSNWEYSILLSEAQVLVGKRVNKIYELCPRKFRLDFGKHSLIISLAEYFYITSTPPPTPQNPPSFSMLLRKHLTNKKLFSFEQYSNDRVYILKFSNGLKLVFEQYAQGNMFLLDENDIIIHPYSFKPTSKKLYKKAQKFPWPSPKEFALPSTIDEWDEFKAKYGDVKIGTALSKLSIGKIYVLEALKQAEADKNQKVCDISGEKASKILEIISNMQKNTSPRVYLSKKTPAEVSLAELEGFEKQKKFDLFGKAVEYFAENSLESFSEGEKSARILKLQKRLEEQKKALEDAEKQIKELTHVARWMELHLPEIDEKIVLEKEKKGKTGGKLKIKID